MEKDPKKAANVARSLDVATDVLLENLAGGIAAAEPPVVQELVLAQRHFEDAQHRVRRALMLSGEKSNE